MPRPAADMPERAASAATLPTWLMVLPWSLGAVGGVNQVVCSLAAEMRRRGNFRPLVLVIDWNAPQPMFEETPDEAAVAIVRWRVGARHAGMGIKDRLAYQLWEMRFRRDFEAFCREHEVAVINPHYVGPASLALQSVASRFRKPVPVMFSFHGADITALETSPAQIAEWRQALQQPRTAAVVCSRALGERLQTVVGNKTAPTIAHNGVDMDALLRSAGPGQPRTRRTILSVGKFEAKKGQSTLLSAFAQIQARFPDVDLLLVGARDQQLPILQAMAEELGIGSRTRFAVDVPHPKIGACFGNADVFALPSRQEPFGLVILEAAAFGLPVIASRVGGIPEIITGADTGRLVDPDDPDQWAAGLAALLDDPAAAAAMGQRLHEDVRQRFSWRKTALVYEALLPTLR